MQLPEAGRRENGGSLLSEHGVSFWGNENVLDLDHGGGCTIKCHWIVHFKMVKMMNFMLREFYHCKKKLSRTR